jgi:uncharacterized membrane protein
MGYGYGPHSGGEVVLFQDARAYVSRSRVVLNGVTYPINGITSVRMGKIDKSPFWLIVGIFALLGCLSFCGIGISHGEGGQIVLGGLAGVFGAGMVAIYIWLQTDTWILFIGSAGMERNGIGAADWRYISQLNEAINQALAMRY